MNIIFSRRSFLAGATAFSLAGCMNGRSGPPGGRPKLKFGVLSDIHITDWASTEIFRKTLRFYRDAGVDAVLPRRQQPHLFAVSTPRSVPFRSVLSRARCASDKEGKKGGARRPCYRETLTVAPFAASLAGTVLLTPACVTVIS